MKKCMKKGNKEKGEKGGNVVKRNWQEKKIEK